MPFVGRKLSGTVSSDKMTVCTADQLLGSYTKVRENLRPLNMDSGDFDLAVAPDLLSVNYEAYGKAYEELFLNHKIKAYHELVKFGGDAHRCTRDARYVWLPLCFEGDRPYIKWMDHWTL